MTKKTAKMKPAPYVAPVWTWQEHRASTIRSWKMQLEYAAEGIKKFADDLTGKNPQYAMEWAASAFTNAARHTVYTVLLSIAEREEITTPEQFLDVARSYADQAIRDGLQQSSTSMASNEAKKRLGEEWLREVHGTWPKNGFEKTIREMFPATPAGCTEFA